MSNCRCIDRYFFFLKISLKSGITAGVISTADRKPFTTFRHLNLYICDPRYRLTFIFEISPEIQQTGDFFVGRIGCPLELSYSPIGFMYGMCT